MSKFDPQDYRFSARHPIKTWPTQAKELARLSSKECAELTARLGEQMNKLQNLLHAYPTRGMLIVLQGMDTAGKDGVIRHVFQHVSPLGVRAEAFGVPSDEESQHDFLWRIHRKAPRRGEMVIFNRSHYEDVLVTRVRQWIDAARCQVRYAHIRNFESLLSSEGIVVVKFFLNISKKEQGLRLQARLDDPSKHWKLKASDFEDREHWEEFIQAYQDAMAQTDTDDCPWYVIPADSKPHRDLLIAQILTHTMEGLKLEPQDLVGRVGLEPTTKGL
jgi:PPK2 family polyphosphate:nucleotide phosphotransferase